MRIQLLLAFLAFVSIFCYSDGMIIPDEPQHDYPVVLNHYVNITVDDTYAKFYVDQEFINEGPRDIEGTYFFPAPSGSIRNFQIVAGGKTVEGKMLDKDEARDLYHRFVMERGDASLLEYSGRETFTASVYLKRGEKVRVQISYEQIISQSSGVYSFTYPLSTERYSSRPIDPVDIKIDIKAPGKIGFITSPTHNVSVARKSEREVLVSYYSKETPDRDLQLFYGVTERDYDVKLLSNKREGEDGYYALFIYPSPKEVTLIPRDIVYVIDTSGSMQGTKIEQAKKALSYGLEHLNADDRFAVVAFSSETTEYSKSLVGISSKEDAKKFVEGLDASGATDIETPLSTASGRLASSGQSEGRARIIVLLTDGEDTTGHSDRAILEAVSNCGCKVFPFGVGTSVDFELLGRISNEKGDGMPTYIRSDSELESSLSLFYDKISRPLLQDVKVEISGDGLRTYDSYPKKIPDIFYGSQINLFGRHSGFGQAKVKVFGTAGGEIKTFEYSVSFPESDSNPFVERTWAVRKLGYLLDTIALEGETSDLREEAKTLATKYGIPSPYTSYVAVNEQGEKESRSLGIEDAMGGWGGLGNSMTTSASYKQTEGYAYSPPETKTIGDKTFVSVGGVWKDTSCGDTVDQTVAFGSNDYLSLISNDALANYLSAGKSVWVCSGKSIMVTSTALPRPDSNPPGTVEPWAVESGAASPLGTGGQGPMESGRGPLDVLGELLPFILLVFFGVAVVVAIIIGRPQEQRFPGTEDEAQLYRALSSDTRIDILKVLEDGEGGRTPSFISEKLGKSKATISEHLDRLLEAKLVEKEEKEGRKWVFYRLTSKGKSVIRKGQGG